MKHKKQARGVSNYPFLFREKILNPKFDSASSDKTQVAVTGTKHTKKTSDNRLLRRKKIPELMAASLSPRG